MVVGNIHFVLAQHSRLQTDIKSRCCILVVDVVTLRHGKIETSYTMAPALARDLQVAI